MNKKKIIISFFALVYIISPIDALPGPIDDAIVALFAVVAESVLCIKNRK